MHSRFFFNFCYCFGFAISLTFLTFPISQADEENDNGIKMKEVIAREILIDKKNKILILTGGASVDLSNFDMASNVILFLLDDQDQAQKADKSSSAVNPDFLQNAVLGGLDLNKQHYILLPTSGVVRVKDGNSSVVKISSTTTIIDFKEKNAIFFNSFGLQGSNKSLQIGGSALLYSFEDGILKAMNDKEFCKYVDDIEKSTTISSKKKENVFVHPKYKDFLFSMKKRCRNSQFLLDQLEIENTSSRIVSLYSGDFSFVE